MYALTKDGFSLYPFMPHGVWLNSTVITKLYICFVNPYASTNKAALTNRWVYY